VVKGKGDFYTNISDALSASSNQSSSKITFDFRVRSINRLILFGLFIILGFGVGDVWNEYYLPGVFAITTSLLLLTGYGLNKKDFSEGRTRNMMLLSYLFIFLYGSFFGKESGIYLFYFPVIIAVASFLRYKKSFQLYIFLGLPVTLILCGELTNYELFLVENLESSYVNFKHLVSVVGGMVLLQLYVQYIVTSYNRKKERLNNSEKNLRTILEYNDSNILLIDSNYRLLDCNTLFKRNFRRAFKYQLESGADMLGFMPDEKVKMEWVERCEKAFRGEVHSYIDTFEYSGKKRTYETKFFPVGTAPNIERLTIMMNDISAHKQAEQKLKQSQKFLQFVIDNIPEGVFWKDKSSVYLGCNKRFAQMLGFSSVSEIIGKTDYEILSDPELARHFIGIDQRVIQTGKPFRMIHRSDMMYQPDGEYKFIDSNKVLLEHNGDIIGVLGTVKDITKLKESEEEFKQQNQALKKLNEELDSLIYRVSHDLRAPIASVLGLINVARMEEDIQKTRAYFDLQEKSLNKLDNFIRDILIYSRNNRQEVEVEEIDFSSLLEQAFCQHSFAEHAHLITKQINIQQTEGFYSDKNRLEVILNNLISNAIRYSATDKQQASIHVDVEVYTHAAYIRIQDNGQGIQKEHLGKIFNMFYRASDRAKGSGLGLYLVQETVRVLKGEIRVESVYKQGSLFEVKIPNLKLQALQQRLVQNQEQTD
jgi:PAS domain S-box-containing protein